MKTYRINERNLAYAPETLVKVKFAGTGVWEDLRLDEVGNYVRNNNLSSAMVVGAEVNGRKTGVFPCIEVKTEAASKAISKIAGYPVEVGDGISLACGSQARRTLQSLVNLGVDLDELVLNWRVAPPTGPEPTPRPIQREIDFSDHPF